MAGAKYESSSSSSSSTLLSTEMWASSMMSAEVVKNLALQARDRGSERWSTLARSLSLCEYDAVYKLDRLASYIRALKMHLI